MAPDRIRYLWDQSIRLFFAGIYADVDYSTIKQYLPQLWRREGYELAHAGLLPLDNICPHRKRIHPEAIRLLGQYLHEVDRDSPISAALSTGLEEMWRRSSHRGYDSESLTGSVFVSLGTMFDPKFLGCNARTFREMESFFQRHSAELFQESPNYWIPYIGALDRMSKNLDKRNLTVMVPTLSSVLHETRLGGRDPRSLFESPALSRKSRKTLVTLIDRNQQRLRYPDGHALEVAYSFKTRPKMHRAGHFHTTPPLGGGLCAGCEPHSMIVDGFGSMVDGLCYDEEFSDNNSFYTDDESLFDHYSIEQDQRHGYGSHDFVPNPYLGLPGLREGFPKQPMLAWAH